MLKLNDYQNETFLVDPLHVRAVLPVSGGDLACVGVITQDGERYDAYAGYGETAHELRSKIEKAVNEAKSPKVENDALCLRDFGEVVATIGEMAEEGFRLVTMVHSDDQWYVAFTKG